MPKYETLNAKPTTKKTIVRLAKKFDFSQVDLLDHMAKYFDKTGVNPKDMKILSPAEELKKFRDTIISFMRTQEKDFLLPVFGKMEMLIAAFMNYLENDAPRRTDKKPNKILTDQPAFSDSNEGQKKEVPGLNIENSNSVSKDKFNEVQNELERSQMINTDLKKELQDIIDNLSKENVSFTKKWILNYSDTQIDDLKKLLNRV